MKDRERTKTSSQLLQSLRKAAGKSGETVSKGVGASRAAVHHWESGRRMPQPQYFEPLMRELNVPEDQWRLLAQQMGYTQYPGEIKISDAEEVVRRARAKLFRIRNLIDNEIAAFDQEFGTIIFNQQAETTDSSTVFERQLRPENV